MSNTTWAEGFERFVDGGRTVEFTFEGMKRLPPQSARSITAPLQFTLASWSSKYIVLEEFYVGAQLCATKVPGTLLSDERGLAEFAPLLLSAGALGLARVLGRPPYMIHDHAGLDIKVVLRNLTGNAMMVHGALIEVPERP